MIELRRVSRLFLLGDQNVKALDAVSLSIAAGEYLSVMGPSGCGKSTLLNVIGLLDRPTSGSYLFKDRDVTTLDEAERARVRREEIGFVFQFFHLVPRLTAAENIELPLMLAGVEPAQRKQTIGKLIKEFGLAGRAHHRPDELSGGERQRVAIARATVMKPSIVLADEPTGNLDQHSGKEVVQLIEELNAKGVAVVVVTHDPAVGARARRQLRMLDGRVVSDRKLMPAVARAS